MNGSFNAKVFDPPAAIPDAYAFRVPFIRYGHKSMYLKQFMAFEAASDAPLVLVFLKSHSEFCIYDVPLRPSN